ncbi:response regulator transcription factor [Gorillibacterium sp. sgz500922]|uniref:response regulator transcription factor n=1 Tax=Gorillibacterium sp. sgz500922 TaxID=3446694 RepID=UPI003F6654BC
MRIMVVEDEAKTRKGIVHLIEKFGEPYEVVGECDNGMDAIDLIGEIKPDVVITDIRMPGMDGVQMLESIPQKGPLFQSIILSGYSDFHMAQRALSLGNVSEYLLKPVTADDLKRALQLTEQRHVVQLLTGQYTNTQRIEPERILRQYLEQTKETKDQIGSSIYRLIGFQPGRELIVVSIYYGECCDTPCTSWKEFIRSLHAPEPLLIMDQVEQRESYIVFQAQDEEDSGKLLLSIQKAMQRSDAAASWVAAWTAMDDLRLWNEVLQTLSETHKWSILSGSEHPLFQETACNDGRVSDGTLDSLDWDAPIKLHLANRDREKLMVFVFSVLHQLIEHAGHPNQVVQGCVKLISRMMHLAESLSGQTTVTNDRNEIFRCLMHGRTQRELKNALTNATDYILGLLEEKKEGFGLLVTKAINRIHKRYQMGVTLDELAEYCRITPEYLSSLFQKETGKSFSAYMKEMRVNMAKDLLLNSTLKSYEIAERVGYQDPKYFAKIFKESTGLTPKEFQQAHL